MPQFQESIILLPSGPNLSGVSAIGLLQLSSKTWNQGVQSSAAVLTPHRADYSRSSDSPHKLQNQCVNTHKGTCWDPDSEDNACTGQVGKNGRPNNAEFFHPYTGVSPHLSLVWDLWNLQSKEASFHRNSKYKNQSTRPTANALINTTAPVSFPRALTDAPSSVPLWRSCFRWVRRFFKPF